MKAFHFKASGFRRNEACRASIGENKERQNSLKIIGFATKLGKPCIHIARANAYGDAPVLALREFVTRQGVKALNVAGLRESKDPGIYVWVMQVLEDAFFWAENHPGMIGGPGEG